MKKRADVTVDFTGVESGGREVADGEYILEVTSIEEKESGEGNPYLAWKWKVTDDGPYKGATIYDNTSLMPKALWRLKQLLECMGVDVSGGKQGIVFAELRGKTCKVKVVNEVYQGKDKPRIGSFLSNSASTSTSTKNKATFKEGQRVTCDYDGVTLGGAVVSDDGKSVIVLMDLPEGEQEEWELTAEDLALAE